MTSKDAFDDLFSSVKQIVQRLNDANDQLGLASTDFNHTCRFLFGVIEYAEVELPKVTPPVDYDKVKEYFPDFEFTLNSIAYDSEFSIKKGYSVLLEHFVKIIHYVSSTSLPFVGSKLDY